MQLIFLQLIQLINRRLSYFAASENYVEILVFVFAIVYVTDFTYGEKLDIDKYGNNILSFLSWSSSPVVVTSSLL